MKKSNLVTSTLERNIDNLNYKKTQKYENSNILNFETHVIIRLRFPSSSSAASPSKNTRFQSARGPPPPLPHQSPYHGRNVQSLAGLPPSVSYSPHNLRPNNLSCGPPPQHPYLFVAEYLPGKKK